VSFLLGRGQDSMGGKAEFNESTPEEEETSR